MWSLDDIADTIAETLRSRESVLRAEQAVHGLDSLQETALHPILATGLESGGWGVLREQPYPHEWKRKLSRSASGVLKPRDRQRCDVVLTLLPSQKLNDAHDTHKRQKAQELALKGSLFESLAAQPETSSPSLIEPEDAFWIELKIVAQHTLSDGVLAPNSTYSSELVRGPMGDVVKLACDERISSAAVILVLFAENEDIARHDVAVLIHKCLDKSLPVASPIMRSVDILDRLGNKVALIAAIGIRRLPGVGIDD
jgi:hypothetical protein